MARPKKQIDKAEVRRLARYQCTNVEIAAAVGCHVNTLTDRFCDLLASCRGVGKTRLRARQYRRAIKGSDTLLIHLGKQYLGQSDKVTAELLAPLPDPVEAYAADPSLMERGLQFERDLADAAAAVPIDAGSPALPRLAVPPAPPSAGGNGNGSVDESDGQQADRRDPG